jgi:elongation factor Ts
MADAKLVMKLRKATSAGMMDCKKALEEANDDFEKAIDILRASGAAKAAKKADREALEGAIRFAVSADGAKGVMARVHCETDFVAKNDDFVASVDALVERGLTEDVQAAFDSVKDELVLKMGENIQFGAGTTLEGGFIVGYVHGNNKIGALLQFSEAIDADVARDIAMHAVAMQPGFLDSDAVSADDLEREKEVYREQLRAEGKPEDMIEKILIGKMNKFYDENCLLEQAFIKDEDKKIKDLIGGATIDGYVLYTI